MKEYQTPKVLIRTYKDYVLTDLISASVEVLTNHEYVDDFNAESWLGD